MEYMQFHPSSNSAAALIPKSVIHHSEMISCATGVFTAVDKSVDINWKRDVI